MAEDRILFLRYSIKGWEVIKLEVLLHGMILAFGLILPLGVQNVFIFNQGALHKRFTGVLPAVVTAGICDTILISLAVAGVSIIVFSFEWLRMLLFAAGALFLAYMGWQMWKSRPEPQQEKGRAALRQSARLPSPPQFPC